MNLHELTILELLRLQAAAVGELCSRGVVRTANNPVGDYAEWLVSKALGLQLAGNSATGYDAISPSGVKVQIKARRITTKNPSRQLSTVRNLERQEFDELVAVVFGEKFEVLDAISIPHAMVQEYGVYRKHVNGHILHLNETLLADQRVKSIRGVLNSVCVGNAESSI